MRVLNGQMEQRKSCDQFRLGKNFRRFLNNRQKASEGHKVGFFSKVVNRLHRGTSKILAKIEKRV